MRVAFLLLAIFGLVSPLLAQKEPEPEEPLDFDVDRLKNESEESGEFDESEESGESDEEDLDMDRMSWLGRRPMMTPRQQFFRAAWMEWRMKSKEMMAKNKNMSHRQMRMVKKEFMMGKRYEWHMMRAKQLMKDMQKMKKKMGMMGMQQPGMGHPQ